MSSLRKPKVGSPAKQLDKGNGTEAATSPGRGRKTQRSDDEHIPPTPNTIAGNQRPNPNTSSSSSDKAPAGKRARIADTPTTQVTEFNKHVPVVAVKESDDFDYGALLKKENEKVLRKRLVATKLNPAETVKKTNLQQAFSIFAIPVVLDTKLLSVTELRAELRTRGQPLGGTKEELQSRLDKFILENEKGLMKELTGRTSKELVGSPNGKKTTAIAAISKPSKNARK
jgi:hypothetical protein